VSAHVVDASQRAAIRRPNRLSVGILVTIATVALLVGSFALWVEREALNTANWTKTSSRVLANPKVQDAVGAYLVRQLFTSVNVDGELKKVLPARVAAPIAAELRTAAGGLVARVLAKPSVQDAWRTANREAHRELIRILNGGGRGVSTRGGVVTLNLAPLVDDLAKALVGGSAVAALPEGSKTIFDREPPQTGQLVIMRSNQLLTAQNIVKGIRGLAIVLPVAAVVLFALAVALARGWRRVVLRRIGWCLIGLGIAVLVARRLLEPRVAQALVTDSSVRPAANAAWLIATSQLRTTAETIIAYGAVIVASAWLAGATRPARALRRVMAPGLRAHPVVLFATVAAILLLLVLWAPSPALRQPIPVLGIATVLALTLEVIRRQTNREFAAAGVARASGTG
jgi:hypothetical protein